MSRTTVTDPDPKEATTRGWRGPARSTIAALLGIVAVLGLVASVVAIWARDTVLDEDVVAGAVGTALEDPEVVSALSVYLTDQVMTAVGVEEFVTAQLPRPLLRFAPAIVGGIQTFLVDQFERVLSAERTNELVVALTRQTHQRLISLLRGDGIADGITVADGEVTVNLLPLMSSGILALQERGWLDRFDIPELDPADPAADHIAALEESLGRDLSDSLGQVVVYRSDSLVEAEATVARAQQLLIAAQRLLTIVIIGTVLAYVVSLLVARRRKRAALFLVVGSAVALLIARRLVFRVVDDVSDLVVQPGARSALRITLETMTTDLVALAGVLIVISALIGLALLLTGGGRRASNRDAAADAGPRALDGSRRTVLGVAVLVGAVAVLMVAGFGTATLITALVLGAIGGVMLLSPGTTSSSATS